ncbi:MAG: hypothetical protein NE327_13590, partial [Lentisphaeraceae bacterium]|nr:hypothetical protein [Lentisphaeraceae bacterium]
FTGLSSTIEKLDAQWMKDSGRNLAVVNPKAPFEAPEQFNESASKDRRRYKKKVLGIWQQLISQNDNLEYSNGVHSVCSFISKDIPRICRDKSREEYFIPLAYKYEGKPIGGNYMHTWEAGTPEQLKNSRASIKENPFKEFFTGGCLFGVPLYGIDQFGFEHSLTNPHYEIPEEAIIQTINSPYTIHPDEILTRESLANIIPFVKALGSEDVTIKYHLPFTNYVIYGINWFLKGKMTRKSLAEYIHILTARVSSQRSYLSSLSSNYGINIKACTTLDSLGLESFAPETIIEQLIVAVGINATVRDGMNTEELQSLKEKLFKGIINYLNCQNDSNGEAWKHINSKIENGSLDMSEHDLLALNYLDYSANLAVSADAFGERETASILPSHEAPVNHFYKKIFAEKFGAVNCFQWLAPLQVHDEELGLRSFHLAKYIKNINELLKLDLLKKCFLQTAAAALDSEEMSELLDVKINKIMSIHEQSVKIDALKEEIILKESEKTIPYVNVFMNESCEI